MKEDLMKYVESMLVSYKGRSLPAMTLDLTSLKIASTTGVITVLYWGCSHFRDQKESSDGSSYLRRTRLHGNPSHCNCRVKWKGMIQMFTWAQAQPRTHKRSEYKGILPANVEKWKAMDPADAKKEFVNVLQVARTYAAAMKSDRHRIWRWVRVTPRR